jgi:D-glycerate 3-kinase
MTDEEVRDFCERFQPAYRAYLPGLYATPPSGCPETSVLRIEIKEDRSLAAPLHIPASPPLP